MAPRKKMRGKPKDLKPRKKKVSPLTKEKIEYVDYKDVNLMRAFISERAKIRARRVSGNDSKQQRDAARAVKNAREMALLPYTSRVVTQRRGDKGRGGDRRSERPGAPGAPAAPPPPPGGIDGPPAGPDNAEPVPVGGDEL